jgi:hypothetical protein
LSYKDLINELELTYMLLEEIEKKGMTDTRLYQFLHDHSTTLADELKERVDDRDKSRKKKR